MAVAAHTFSGSIRRFGAAGVLYEVLREVDEKFALIRVIETGEETKYPLSAIENDPTE